MLRRLVALLAVALAPCAGADAQDCQPAHYDRAIELHVTAGRPALRRPLERLLRDGADALATCFVAHRPPAGPPVSRDATATVAVQPDGHLVASVALRPHRGDGALGSDAEDSSDVDESIRVCLEQRLAAATLTRPRVAVASSMELRLRFVVTVHPARPCSDPAPPRTEPRATSPAP